MGKYLLPDGETLVTDLKCAVVVYPDSDRYRRALWGAISQLTKYWMWEPDGAGGEYDAADSWDEAYEATLENFGMLETIIDHIDEVEELLRALQTLQNAGAPCCEHLAPTNAEHEFDDSVYPDTPPATWGDGEPIADASDWEQLVCGAAHAYVDHLKNIAEELNDVVEAGAIVVGTIAGLLGFLSGAGIVLAIGYGTAAAIVGGLIALATEATFGGTAAELEAARSDIVCAIVDGGPDQLASAVEGAISSLAWSLFYSYIDYASARNIMLEGSHGEEFLGVNRRTDCDCQDPHVGDTPFLIEYTFDDTDEGWTTDVGFNHDAAEGYMWCSPNNNARSSTGLLRGVLDPDIDEAAGIDTGPPRYIRRITVEVGKTAGSAYTWNLHVRFEDGTDFYSGFQEAVGTFIFDIEQKPLEDDSSPAIIELLCDASGEDSGARFWMDRIVLDGSATAV